MLIKLSVIGDNVSVVIRVTNPDSAVRVDLNVVIAVSDIELLKASVGLNGPVECSVFFGYGKDPQNVGHEIIIVKTVVQNIE